MSACVVAPSLSLLIVQAANVFTVSNVVKTTYTAVKISIVPGGSVTVDTTDKRFTSTTFGTYPTSLKAFVAAPNYASAVTCAPLLAAHGTGAPCLWAVCLASCIPRILHW